MSDIEKHDNPDPRIEFDLGSSISMDSIEDNYITVKPFRFFVLVLLLFAMYTHRIPVWFGGGLLVIYFSIQFMIKRFITRMMMIPFKLKGQALAGATIEVHGYEWTETPDSVEEDATSRYAWIDATITPPILTEGFNQWEPGELMLCPSWYTIKKISDLDVCLSVEDVRYLQGEGSVEGDKCSGIQRVQLLVGIPEGQYEFVFVYYLEVFGELNLAD